MRAKENTVHTIETASQDRKQEMIDARDCCHLLTYSFTFIPFESFLIFVGVQLLALSLPKYFVSYSLNKC